MPDYNAGITSQELNFPASTKLYHTFYALVEYRVETPLNIITKGTILQK